MLSHIALSLLVAANTQASFNEEQSTSNRELPKEQEVSVGTKPIPRSNPDRWVTPNDYPVKALRRELQGTTIYLVTVSPKGRVESCVITKSSGHAILDITTCKVVKRRARFRPATNKNGTPVIGEYSGDVEWYLPD